MKEQLKAIYDNFSQDVSTLAVKVEPTYEAKGYNRFGRDGFYKRGQNNSSFNNGGRERGRFNRGGSQSNMDWRNKNSDDRKQNPINTYGRVSRCAVCQSIYHWAKDCPHNEWNKNPENKITLFTQ